MGRLVGWLVLLAAVLLFVGVLVTIPLVLGGPWWGLLAPVGAVVGFIGVCFGLIEMISWACYKIGGGY